MENLKLLLVVKDEAPRAAYEAALANLDVQYDVAGSFSEILQMSVDNVYSGLLVDILTLIRSNNEEKAIAYECINRYPSLRIKWDVRLQSMSLSPLEQALSADIETTLRSFIETSCRPFTARALRIFPRVEVHLCLVLARDPQLLEEADRTFTVNISQGGAFVHTSRTFARGGEVWLSFQELADLEPIRGEVRWGIEWGDTRSIPGIGIRFASITDAHARRLRTLAIP